MLNVSERWVQFYEIYLKSEPEDAPVIELKDLIPLWLTRITKKEAVKLIDNDTAAIRIVDSSLRATHNALVLLLQYTDTKVTDPAFSHLETGTLRVEPKLEGEGVAVSAHMIISTIPHDTGRQLYRVMIEEVPGLGRSVVAPFVRSELKTIAKGKFQYKDADANNATKNYRPAAEILGNPSKQFTDDLNEGCILQSIELIKFAKESGGIDEEGFYTETSRHVKLIPEKTFKDKAIEVVGKVKKRAKDEGYDNVKFRYKHPLGKQKTATMGSTEEDIADMLVAKSELIKSEEPLEQCHQKIVVSFSNEMVRFLRPESQKS